MKSRGYLLATASSVAAVAAAGGAHAADMGLPAKAPYTPPPVASWAGFYIGGNVGIAWEQMTAGYSDPRSTGVGEFALPGTISASRFIGGGQIGYNWQSGNFVYGLEGDFSGLAGSFGQSGNVFTAGKGNTQQSRINWLSTIRGRMGLAVTDTMAYVTGGVAIGGVKNVFSPNGTAGLAFDEQTTVKSQTKTKVGWTVGGGIEHMLSPNWTVGVEALFVDLGTSTATVHTFEGNTKSSNFRNQAVIGRLKLNYKW